MLLDVPNLSVDEITLEVDNLRAKVSLDARLANLLQLTAGADASIDKVKLTIKGDEAILDFTGSAAIDVPHEAFELTPAPRLNCSFVTVLDAPPAIQPG